MNEAKEQLRKEIIEAYLFLRKNNQTIPSTTLEFMKDTALDKLESVNLPSRYLASDDDWRNSLKVKR